MMVASVTYTKKPEFMLEDGLVAVEEEEEEMHNDQVDHTAQ